MLTDDVSNKFWCSDFCRELLARADLLIYIYIYIYLSCRKAAYDTSDPSEGLMNLLKKMYAEGDDEMKRTINKAWVESREKQSKGDIPMDI